MSRTTAGNEIGLSSIMSLRCLKKKRKKEKLQQLELCDSLHGKTEEIKRVSREINEIQVREEIMWN